MADLNKPLLDENIGDATLRIVAAGTGYHGAVIRRGKRGEVYEDEDLSRLTARLRNEAGKLHPNYVGMDGAIKRFLTFFPAGFEDAGYLEAERQYKLAARERLLSALPLADALSPTAAQAQATKKAFQTNMLSPFEAARVNEVLSSSDGWRFVQGAAEFTMGDHAGGLEKMKRAIEPHGKPSWPMVTYLPNFWAPDEHMFLKPQKTRDFAERIGHPFAHEYSASLEVAVYSSLLDLVATTETALVTLRPRDRIDVQSFIWVVGDYGENEMKQQP